MAMKFCDGFDRYGVAADLDLRWVRANTPIYQTTGGVTGGGGGCVRCDSSEYIETRDTFSVTLTAGGNVHAAVWMNNLSAQGIAGIIMAIGTNLFTPTSGNAPTVGFNTSNAVFVKNHGNGTILATSVNGVITTGQYQHVEYQAKYADAGGFIKVWVDRTLVIDFSGDTLVGTQPTEFNKLNLHVIGSFSALYDDPVIWDETGTDFVHTQLGATNEHVIEAFNMQADDSIQFSPDDSGVNFDNVNDSAFHDGDGSYNESTTVGHVDLFTVVNQVTQPAITFAVVQHTVARKTDAGGATLRNRVVSGATTQESGDFALTTSYAHYCDYAAVGKDPNTGAAWTPSGFDAVKVGYEYQV